MEAKLLKEDLAGALSSVLGVVEKRQTLPILANVLIDFSDSGINMTATDLESEIALSSVRGEISSPGKTTVSAKKLNDLVRLLPRSEEHTSESSHTVISYAVFCLKKKNKNNITISYAIL